MLVFILLLISTLMAVAGAAAQSWDTPEVQKKLRGPVLCFGLP